MPQTPSETCAFLYSLIEGDYSKQIFGPNFQNYGDFCSYFEKHYGTTYDIHRVLMTKRKWSAEDFHALFIACWIYKPMEKGTYFFRMTSAEAHKVKVGFETLPTRKSSHLSGKGRSAHAGWAFLKGYAELLVQWHNTGSRTYLMLKAEGHTTSLSSIVPHMKSWNHKRKHGEGLRASDALHATTGPGSPIISRGAENFSTDYKTFLKELGDKSGNPKLKKATTSVRDMLNALTGKSDWSRQPNKKVRQQLEALSTWPQGNYNEIKLNTAVKEQFKRFATLFELDNRPDAIYQRFFEEVHVNPNQLSNAVKEFMTWDLPVSTTAQTQRRSRMLHF